MATSVQVIVDSGSNIVTVQGGDQMVIVESTNVQVVYLTEIVEAEVAANVVQVVYVT